MTSWSCWRFHNSNAARTRLRAKGLDCAILLFAVEVCTLPRAMGINGMNGPPGGKKHPRPWESKHPCWWFHSTLDKSIQILNEVSAWLVRTVTHRFSIYPNTLPATIIAGLAYIRLQVGPIVTPPGRRGPNRNGWWLKLWNHPKIMCTRWLLGMSWSLADKNHLYLLWNNLYKGKAPAERKKGLKVRVNPHGPEADFLSKK